MGTASSDSTAPSSREAAAPAASASAPTPTPTPAPTPTSTGDASVSAETRAVPRPAAGAPEPAETRAIPLLGDRQDASAPTAAAGSTARPSAGDATPSSPPPLREPDDPNPSVRTWYLPGQAPSAPAPSAPAPSGSADAPSPAAVPTEQDRPAVARPTPSDSAANSAADVSDTAAPPTTDPRALDLGDLRRATPTGPAGSGASAPSTSGGDAAPPTDGVNVLFGDLDPDPITGAVPLPGPATAAAGLLRRLTGRDSDEEHVDDDAATDARESDPADEPSGDPDAADAPRSGLSGLLRRLTDRDQSSRDEAPVDPGPALEDADSAAPAPIDDDVADFDPAPELGRADRLDSAPSVEERPDETTLATADAGDGLDGSAPATRVFGIPDADVVASPETSRAGDLDDEEAGAEAAIAPEPREPTATPHDDEAGSDRASSATVPRPVSAGPLPTVAADGAPRFALAPSGEPQSGRSTLLEKIAFGASIVIAPVGLAANVVLAALSARRRGWTHRLTSAGIAVGVAMTIVSAGLLALGDSAAQDAIEHRSLQAQSGAFCHLIATEPVGAEQKDFGWPAAQSSIPESVAAAQAFIDRWDAVAAVAPTGIRAQVTQIAGMGRELLTQIQETQTADDATAQQRLSALRDQSDVPGWISEYCD
ncbi:hypothetical protein [Schumannella sp. 10F1B-5-1]|uniref:hypothetical protein n=1 Tax=Schumannella sp. 10F1B-5-1 TaxID=2590780 RepID=UPI0011326681|nr:hypothetical protein [Schumannella sp. 10F1B-5-1]TPW70299.1 hypothetical protein FJ658_14920 [Schumannella sp. 10F1B-5-1]